MTVRNWWKDTSKDAGENIRGKAMTARKKFSSRMLRVVQR